MKDGARKATRRNDILAYLFGNDASEPLLHVTACPQEENVAENCEQISFPTDASLDGKWFCYGTAAARAVFDQSPDNYLNAVTCYVAKTEAPLRPQDVGRDLGCCLGGI